MDFNCSCICQARNLNDVAGRWPFLPPLHSTHTQFHMNCVFSVKAEFLALWVIFAVAWFFFSLLKNKKSRARNSIPTSAKYFVYVTVSHVHPDPRRHDGGLPCLPFLSLIVTFDPNGSRFEFPVSSFALHWCAIIALCTRRLWLSASKLLANVAVGWGSASFEYNRTCVQSQTVFS